MNVPFHASTYRRVKLGEVADFQVFVMLRDFEASLIANCLGSEQLEIPRLCSE